MMLRPQSFAVNASVARDVAGRDADVALGQRHDLGPRRGARGVQDQRDFVGLGKALACSCRMRSHAVRRKQPAPLSCSGCRRDDGHAELLRDRDRRRRAALLDHQGLGLEVGQVEFEFVGLVGRVERRRGRARGNRDEGRRPCPVRSAARSRRDRCGRCQSRSASRWSARPARAGRDRSARAFRARRPPARRRRLRPSARAGWSISWLMKRSSWSTRSFHG